MAATADDRAQAVQVGAILLFGFLIVALAVTQAVIVPNENRAVEFEAYQETSGDMIQLRGDLQRAATQDATTTTRVKAGASYPPRTFLVNPSPPIGSVETTDKSEVWFNDTRAVDGSAANTRAFWSDNRSYETRAVRFEPGYNELSAEPMVFTGESLFREADAGVVPLAGQTLVQGDRITLHTIAGDLSAGDRSVAITTDPVSATTRTVAITGDDGEDITMTVDPGTDADDWAETVGERMVATNDRVLGVTPDGDRVRVTLDGDRTYRLTLAQVELRERDDSGIVGDPDPAYVVPASERTQTTARGQPIDVAVEVRDEFNNAGSTAGIEVELELDDESSGGLTTDGATPERTVTVTTDEDGIARATFVPDASFRGTTAITATVPAIDPSGAGFDTTRFDVNVVAPGDRGGTGSEVNPSADGDVVLQETSLDGTTVDMTFENRANVTRSIEEARINFFFPASPGTVVRPTSGTIGTDELLVGGGFEPVDPIELPPDDPSTVTIEFDEDVSQNQDNLFAFSVIFEDGDTATYFVSVSGDDGGQSGEPDPPGQSGEE